MVRFTALLTMLVLVASTSTGTQSPKTPTLVITRGGSRPSSQRQRRISRVMFASSGCTTRSILHIPAVDL